MSTDIPPRGINLLKTARTEYIAETKGLVNHEHDEEDTVRDNASDSASQQSDTRADLTLLGVDLDDETISRLETNLGVTLFNTATKAAQTLRVSSSIRNKIKEGQTPMGHLMDEELHEYEIFWQRYHGYKHGDSPEGEEHQQCSFPCHSIA